MSDIYIEWLREKAQSPYFAAYRGDLLSIANALATVTADRDAARAECERLRKDAERYLWLREQYEHTRLPLAAVVWKQNNDRQSSEWVNLVNGDALDAAIDAALAAKEPT